MKRAALVFSVGVTVACGTSFIREPDRHRDKAEPCSTTRSPENDPDPHAAPGTCLSDFDCQLGKNGQCVWALPAAPLCSYDECFTDVECGNGVCDCRVPTRFHANVCFKDSACHTDADCKDGNFCSPSGDNLDFHCSPPPPAKAGFFCHGKLDACVSDTDCPAGEYCLFDGTAARFKCFLPTCTQ